MRILKTRVEVKLDALVAIWDTFFCIAVLQVEVICSVNPPPQENNVKTLHKAEHALRCVVMYVLHVICSTTEFLRKHTQLNTCIMQVLLTRHYNFKVSKHCEKILYKMQLCTPSTQRLRTFGGCIVLYLRKQLCIRS